MTLGQFAAMMGAPPRWVQNASAVLRLRGPYDDERARHLGLARVLAESTGMPLVRAWPIAGDALAAWPRVRVWEDGTPDGPVRVVIDVERYLSAFATRLALVRTSYEERARGPRRRRPRNATAAARVRGVDVTLFDESLKLTPGERLRRLDEMSEFFGRARVARAG
jgi:hypothetical protein